MTDDQKLLEEYSKELHRGDPNALTLERLIESHRYLRSLNREWIGAFDEAAREGKKVGIEQGLKLVEANTIQYEDLRKMTIQDLANLIGED